MRNARVWARLLGIEHAVIEGLEYDEDEQLLVAHVGRHGPAEDVAGSA